MSTSFELTGHQEQVYQYVESREYLYVIVTLIY